MVVQNRETKTLHLIEIKHSYKRIENQTKWSVEDNIINRLIPDDNIASRTVLYRGETAFEHNIKYVNIEEYLHILHNDGIKTAIQFISTGCTVNQCFKN